MMTTAYEQAIEFLGSNGATIRAQSTQEPTTAPEPGETHHLVAARRNIEEYKKCLGTWGRDESAMVARDLAMMHAAYANAEAATRQAEVAESMLEFVADLVGGTDLVNALLQWSYRQKTG